VFDTKPVPCDNWRGEIGTTKRYFPSASGFLFQYCLTHDPYTHIHTQNPFTYKRRYRNLTKDKTFLNKISFSLRCYKFVLTILQSLCVFFDRPHSIPDPEYRTNNFFTIFFRPFSRMLNCYLHIRYNRFVSYSLSLELELTSPLYAI